MKEWVYFKIENENWVNGMSNTDQTKFYLPIFLYKPKKVVLEKFGLVNGKEKMSPVKYLTHATMPGTAHSFSTH